MDLLRAIRAGQVEQVREILVAKPNLVNFRNENFDALLSTVKPKSTYCGECYQRIKQKPIIETSIRGYVCDWPKHRRCAHKNDLKADICCCDTPSAEVCNWMVCPECFIISSFELKAPHQLVAKKEGYTPLIVACCLGNVEIVHLLLQHDALVNEADPNGVTALHAAASMGHSEVLLALLQAEAALDAVDNEGRTALQRAVEVESAACAETLMEAGADVSIQDKEGATLLHAAASVGHVGLIKAFLEAGLDPNIPAKDGGTPLHWLPTECRAPALNLLLDAGALLDVFDREAMSPLTYAVMRDNVTLVKLMLRAGASMHIRAASWYNCLYASCLFHAPRVTEALLEAGAAMNPGQPSPLMLCAQRNLAATADVCLRHGVPGADRALEFAAHLGKIPVLKVFLQHWSGEGEMSDDVLNLALIHAARADHFLAVKLLLEHGADPAYRHLGRAVLDYSVSKRMRGLLHAHISGQAVEIDPEDEALVLSNKDFLKEALESGTKPWGRSKIMIVGDGRAGKTALARSLIGEDFRHTESTIGISQMTCDVKHAEVGGEGSGSWEEYTKPDKELEAALARIVALRRGLLGEESDSGSDSGDEDEEDSQEGDAVGGEGGAGDAAEGTNNHEAPATSGRKTGKVSSRGLAGMRIDDNFGDGDEEGNAGGKVGGLAIDDELVMKYLANLNNSTKFVISLFDYGGQSVFNVIHHLFLTRYGVYTLVFNMEQLVTQDAAVREGCLSTLSFWLNSIVMHTYSESTGKTAPIFLVGTHKDVVSSAADHKAVSDLLLERFGQSVVWASVVPNIEVASASMEPSIAPASIMNVTVVVAGDAIAEAVAGQPETTAEEATAPDYAVATDSPPADEETSFNTARGHVPTATSPSLWFFPVDNRRGRRDTTIASLMRRAEQAIDASNYVHSDHPLTWLRTMDQLTSSERVYLSLQEVTDIAEACGVEAAAVEALLSFLHEMGIVMWHADAALRDVVILDPVAYFVAPATTIICKHLSSASDGTRHVVDAHRACNKAHYAAWMRMVHSGIASADLLLQLLAECGEQASVVLQLMVKFGLLVPLETTATTSPTSAGSVTVHCSPVAEDGINYDEVDKWEAEGNGEVFLKADGREERALDDADAPVAVVTSAPLLEYLVPALLPSSPASLADDESAALKGEGMGAELHLVAGYEPAEGASFLFVFTCAQDFSERAQLSAADCAARGFLPRGLFERLLCKAVAWSREACRSLVPKEARVSLVDRQGGEDVQGEAAVQVPQTPPQLKEQIFQDFALLTAGSDVFSLQVRPALNSIVVRVLAGDAGQVRRVLYGLVQQILRECMKSLRCVVAWEFGSDSGGGDNMVVTPIELL